ncbi:hypothetical protein [Marinimicrobium alkaliphilum]|uniref:hypothetical protein n=1 Tax=Marinimicrobium alkaliphilum TaxID=2202654 RepID=UPI000DBA57E1|nr:hypothetical protein [Marinimicrobium alkaliphilum]
MDILSLAIGFLVGSFTGAAGTYLGNKYTDKRREAEVAHYIDEEWEDVKRRFPKIIDEIIEDSNHPDFKSVRKFFVCESTWSISKSEPSFEYHTDKHPDLSAAIAHLEELGYIEDITPGNCPMYRIRERFVDKLRGA